jgi:hypothetical protein
MNFSCTYRSLNQPLTRAIHASYLPNRLVRLKLDILNAGIDHERHEIQNQVRILPQPDEGGVAEALEASIV